MEKKTAMELLIQWLQATHTLIPQNTKENRRAKGAYVDAIQKAKSLLPKEREQIEEAFKEGAKKRFNTMLIKRDEINKAAFDYFTQTYGKG